MKDSVSPMTEPNGLLQIAVIFRSENNKRKEIDKHVKSQIINMLLIPAKY